MPASATVYTRRLAHRRSLVAVHSLWLASDHLLTVTSYLGAYDVFRRIYFRDLQALTVRVTALRPFNIAAALLLAALGAVGTALAVRSSHEPWLALGYVFPLGMLVWAGLLIWRGRTCNVYLRSAVQTLDLGAVGDWRGYQKLRAEVYPLVAAAQGVPLEQLLPEDDTFRERVTTRNLQLVDHPPRRAKAARPHPRQVAQQRQEQTLEAPPLKPCNLAWHRALFAMLLVTAGFNVPGFVVSGKVYVCISLVITLATLLCLVMALVRQHGTDLSPAVRKVVWVWLGYTVFSYIAGIGVSGYYSTQYSTEALFDLATLEHPPLLVLLSLDLVVCLTLGLIGFQALATYQQARATAAATPVAAAPAPTPVAPVAAPVPPPTPVRVTTAVAPPPPATTPGEIPPPPPA